MIGPYVVAGRAQAGNRSQQVVWLDSAPHFARCGRCFEQGLERGAESLLEVGWQGVVCRVAGVKSCRKSTFSGNKVNVTLHPSSQRLAGFMLGRQECSSVCAGVNLAAENGHDEV